ncbi:MAG TPA: hypothetical protein VMU98_09300 [Acidimicrobiales bacterium]|nr:hypothetical protein [Acidimicrobiales bacterium]
MTLRDMMTSVFWGYEHRHVTRVLPGLIEGEASSASPTSVSPPFLRCTVGWVEHGRTDDRVAMKRVFAVGH